MLFEHGTSIRFARVRRLFGRDQYPFCSGAQRSTMGTTWLGPGAWGVTTSKRS